MLKKRIFISTFILLSVTHTIALGQFLIVKLCDSSEYAGTVLFLQPL